MSAIRFKISSLPVAPGKRLAERVHIHMDASEYMQEPPEVGLIRSRNGKRRKVVSGRRGLPCGSRIWMQGETALLRGYSSGTRRYFHNHHRGPSRRAED